MRCLILNACYSQIQADEIARHIPFVIGMNDSISDKAAIAFSVGFYKAIGSGKTIDKAFKFACVELQLENIPEEHIPILHQKKL